MDKEMGFGADVKRRHIVSIVRYEKPGESAREAVDACKGLEVLPRNSRVFIKPNIVFWTREVAFPKWGVITTSRVVEDMVLLLKERGIDDIMIGEGPTMAHPKDVDTPAHAFESLGYRTLEQRYGVRCINVHERPFDRVDLGDDVHLRMNRDLLESDFLVNLPVLKTHAQTVVSLGTKNLKGALDIPSRKKCHSADPHRDLNDMISRLPDVIPPSFTLLDGIYTNARGPGFDGKIRRSNLLIAGGDLLSTDMVGAEVLGYNPGEVPYLSIAAQRAGRPCDLSDIEIRGEDIQSVASRHEYTFPYTEDGSLPLPMKRLGIQGLTYRKYDLTMCTFCSFLNGVILTAIAQAWNGEPWDDVEVLTGKSMSPTPGKKKTILMGKCIYQANKDHPDINRMFAVKSCPPSTKGILKAFHEAGIELNPSIFEHMEKAPGFFLKKYEGKPEFEESFFRIS